MLLDRILNTVEMLPGAQSIFVVIADGRRSAAIDSAVVHSRVETIERADS